MQGNADLRSPSRRAAVSAISAVLVLAFALFPVLAQASDSAHAQYQDRLPTATGPGGNGGGNDGGGNGGKHDGSSNGQTSGGGGGGSSSGGGGGGSSPSSGSGPSGSSGGGSSESSPGSAGQAGASGGTGTGSLQLGQNTADQTSSGDGGGSSPLAGILVGLGLGAIVSVIFVVLRARRQRGQSEPVQSPNAG